MFVYLQVTVSWLIFDRVLQEQILVNMLNMIKVKQIIYSTPIQTYYEAWEGSSLDMKKKKIFHDDIYKEN